MTTLSIRVPNLLMNSLGAERGYTERSQFWLQPMEEVWTLSVLDMTRESLIDWCVCVTASGDAQQLVRHVE